MRNKKVAILIVLSIAAAASVIYGIVTPSSGRRRAAQPKEAVPSGEKKVEESVAPSRTRGHAVKSKYKSWKRELFVPTGGSVVSATPVLRGILSSGENLKAMIDDVIVGKGDKVGDNTVVEVRKNSVILNDGTTDFEIKLAE